jgi:HEAT repeat protein
MVSIILSALVVAASGDQPPASIKWLPEKQQPLASGQKPQTKETEDAFTVWDVAFSGFAFFATWGIVMDVDSLDSVPAPGAPSLPGELLQRLQAKDKEQRTKAVECFYYLATMSQTGAWIEGKSDGARRFRLALGRLGRSYETALNDCLKDPSPAIRFKAGTALLVLEPNHPKALQAVVDGLQTMAPDFLQAVGPLRFTHQKIIACLVNALGHRDAKVRKAAAAAIIEIGPSARAAVPALVEMLKSNDAIDDLYALWPYIGHTRANLAVEALSVMGPDAAPAVPTLIEMLKTSEEQDRAGTLVCLARIGPAAQQAVVPVRQLLEDQHGHSVRWRGLWRPVLDIRLGAACTLLRILQRDDEALSVLKDALGARDENLRRVALEACTLTGLKEKALVPDFIRAVKDKALQEAAANALAEVGPDAREAVPVLLEILMNEHNIHTENHEASRALAQIGKAGLPALITVAQQRGADTRSAALFALSSFDDEAQRVVPVLINGLVDMESRPIAAVALGKLGSQARQARLPLLVAYLYDRLGTNEELFPLLELWALRQLSQATPE